MAKSIPFPLYKVKKDISVEAKSLFLQRLAGAVEKRGLSQNALADRLSALSGERVYPSAINNWLKQGTMPSGDMLIWLPDALEVDGHWLLTGEGAMERVPPERASVALSVIETVVDASRDQEAFDRFWGHWLEFKRLSEGDDEPDEATDDPRP